LDRDIEEFISKRCATALLKDEEYRNLLLREHEPEEELELAIRICYIKGFNDRNEICNV
jgi:hypothetical protein